MRGIYIVHNQIMYSTHKLKICLPMGNKPYGCVITFFLQSLAVIIYITVLLIIAWLHYIILYYNVEISMHALLLIQFRCPSVTSNDYIDIYLRLKMQYDN